METCLLCVLCLATVSRVMVHKGSEYWNTRVRRVLPISVIRRHKRQLSCLSGVPLERKKFIEPDSALSVVMDAME